MCTWRAIRPSHVPIVFVDRNGSMPRDVTHTRLHLHPEQKSLLIVEWKCNCILIQLLMIVDAPGSTQHYQHRLFRVSNAHGIDYLVSKQRIHFYLMRVHNIWFRIMHSYSMRGACAHRTARQQASEPSHRIFLHGQLLMKLKLIKTSWSTGRLSFDDVLFSVLNLWCDVERMLFHENNDCLCAPHHHGPGDGIRMCTNAPEISHAVQTLNVNAKSNRRRSLRA